MRKFLSAVVNRSVMAVYSNNRSIVRKRVSLGRLLVTTFCVSQRNERRINSKYGDVCDVAGYRFASALAKGAKGAGKSLRFVESAEIHTSQELRVSVTEDTEQELARAKTDARTNG